MGEIDESLHLVREAIHIQKTKELTTQKRFVILAMMFLLKATVLNKQENTRRDALKAYNYSIMVVETAMEKFGPSVKKLLDNMKNEAFECLNLVRAQTEGELDLDNISDDS